MATHKEEEFEVEEHLDIIQRYLGLQAKTFYILLLFVVGMGIYIGIILYGKNSVFVLLKLQTYESYLQEDIARLKKQNASLQKEFFELKEISGESEKKEQ